MEIESFEAEIPSQRTNEFSSLEECEEALLQCGIQMRSRQSSRGTYRSSLSVRGVGTSIIGSGRYNTGLTMTTAAPPQMAMILFPCFSQGRFVSHGKECDGTSLLVIPADTEADILLAGLSGSDGITIPQASLTAMTEVLCIAPDEINHQEAKVVHGNSTSLAFLRSKLLHLKNAPGFEPSKEDFNWLITGILDWTEEALTSPREESFRFNGTRKRIAKRTQAYLEENYRGTVRLDDLCRISGSSIRTLQRSFQEHFCQNISDYLLTLRLDEAYRKLYTSDAIETSVSKIALDNGFTHLGRFSTKFHKHFGISAKDLLKRKG